MRQRAAGHRCERQESAVSDGRKTGAQWGKRRGQSYMQSDRGVPGRRCIERARLALRKTPAYDHRRSRVDAAARDEIADRGIDARRNAVIVGTEPDAAELRFVHSAAVRASRAAAVPTCWSCWASLRSCSATK